MYKEHPIFKSPDNENEKIWRYTDFTKFVSLMDRQSLFFARADKLGDPFEGSRTKLNIDQQQKNYKSLRLQSGLSEEWASKISQTTSGTWKKFRECMFVNCWNRSDYESAALWKLHLKTGEGIAIQSTFKRLIESLSKDLEHEIYIGKVNYIDYETELMREDNAFYPLMHKRRSFEMERELRAVIMKYAVKVLQQEKSSPLGLYISVDLDILVEKLFVSPTAPEWFSDLVTSVVNKYGLKMEVIQSSLAGSPIF